MPSVGIWYADVVMVQDPDFSGRVSMLAGELSMSGTVHSRYDGTRGQQRMFRLVGGNGGWSTLLPPKHYHADNGVKAISVATDIARSCGETLGNFVPSVPVIGKDYARGSSIGSRVLEDVIGGASWWVDFAGVTQVGTREQSTPENGSYQVLDFDPKSRLVTLSMDDLRSVVIGSVLSAEGLDQSQVVRELEFVIKPESVRVMAWTAGVDGSRGRLQDAFSRAVRASSSGEIFGKWRYRVVRMNGARVNLQVVSTRAGLPNLLPLSMFPGMAGFHAELAQGAEVLVEFAEGKRTQPIITAFAGKDGAGFIPVSVVHDIITEMKLGAGATQFVALANKVVTELNAVRALVGSHVHAVTVTGTATTQSGTTAPAGGAGSAGSVAATKIKAE